MAFLALLVVAGVSTLIITAASASAGRIANRTEEQQVILTAQSITEILTDKFNGMQAKNLSSSEWSATFSDIPYGSFFTDSAKEILKNGSSSPQKKLDTEIRLTGFSGTELDGISIEIRLCMNKDKKPSGAPSALDFSKAKEAMTTICLVTAKKDGYSYSSTIVLSPDLHVLSATSGIEKISLRWYVSEITKGDFYHIADDS